MGVSRAVSDRMGRGRVSEEVTFEQGYGRNHPCADLGEDSPHMETAMQRP